MLATMVFQDDSLSHSFREGEARIIVTGVFNQVGTQSARVSANSEMSLNPTFVLTTVGQVLRPGDILKTGPNSEVRIEVTARRFTRIARALPDTLWRVTSVSLEENADIALDKGTVILFENDKRPHDWHTKVVTPAGSVIPHGTWLSVSYATETGVTDVQCFRGICELENENGKLVLTESQKSAVTSTSSLKPAADLYESDKLVFTQLPEVGSLPIQIPSGQDEAMLNLRAVKEEQSN